MLSLSQTVFGLPLHPLVVQVAVILVPLAAIVFGLALLAGCGGDSGDDPQQVLDDTFNADQQAHSGVLDLTIDVTIQGLPEAALRDASIGIATLAVSNL